MFLKCFLTFLRTSDRLIKHVIDLTMARKILVSTLLYRCFKHSGKYKELSCSRWYGSFWDYTKRTQTWRQSKPTGELWQDPQDAQNNLLPSTLKNFAQVYLREIVIF